MRYRMRRGGWNRVGDGTRKKERVKRSGGKKDTVVHSNGIQRLAVGIFLKLPPPNMISPQRNILFARVSHGGDPIFLPRSHSAGESAGSSPSACRSGIRSEGNLVPPPSS
jgi:hypothetical protein